MPKKKKKCVSCILAQFPLLADRAALESDISMYGNVSEFCGSWPSQQSQTGTLLGLTDEDEVSLLPVSATVSLSPDC